MQLRKISDDRTGTRYSRHRWLMRSEVVNYVVNAPLDGAKREQYAGTFSVALGARDTSGDPGVIENKLEKSDHHHLDMLLTYLLGRLRGENGGLDSFC